MLKLVSPGGLDPPITMSSSQDAIPTEVPVKPANYSTVSSTIPTTKLVFEQAIILPKITEAHYVDYLEALSEIIDSSKLICCDSLPNDRIIVWLDSQKSVDDLVDSKKHIVVCHQVVYIRPYIHRNKRIVFTHCFPQVENSFLELKLAEAGIKILSPITVLKLGIQNTKFSHIVSQKRETYIASEDADKLPPRIVAIVCGKEMYVNILSDDKTCHKCKKPGHTYKNCPSSKVDSTLDNSMTASQYQRDQNKYPNLPPPKPQKPRASKFAKKTPEIPLQAQNSSPTPNPKEPEASALEIETTAGSAAAEKRRHSPTLFTDTSVVVVADTQSNGDDENLDEMSDSGAQTDVSEKTHDDEPSCSKKKLKVEGHLQEPRRSVKQSNSQKTWEECEAKFEGDPEDFPLKFHSFQELLEETRKPSEIVDNARKLTSDMKGVRHMFDYLRNYLPTSLLRKRTDKIIKQLDAYLTEIQELESAMEN